MSDTDYVHGYGERERARLIDQAVTLTHILHSDTHYPPGSHVLEAGCGVGAQTVTLARQSPGAAIVSVDISEDSLRSASERVAACGLTNVRFQQGDIYRLPFAEGTFDHVFLCFVLEHLADPAEALARLKPLIRTGGTVTVIEGDHGSAYFHPDSATARRAIQCLVDLQAEAGGDSLIGRRLYPVLVAAGFRGVRVSPRLVYVDSSRPELVEGFTRNTFAAMVEGVRSQTLAAGMMAEREFDQGVRDLYRTAAIDGTFSYTFFKAVAVK